MIDRLLVKKILKHWATEFELKDYKITVIITQDRGTRWRGGKVYIKPVDFYGECLVRTDTSDYKEVWDFMIVITEQMNEKQMEDTIIHELLHIKFWHQNWSKNKEHRIIYKIIREINREKRNIIK